VKRFYADDSAATSVKVGHRQASYKRKTPVSPSAFKIALVQTGVFFRPRFFISICLDAHLTEKSRFVSEIPQDPGLPNTPPAIQSRICSPM
ncbi:hypothetical protein, partial [Massilia sp. CCM 8734]|uniref:hypothetical protein n=1 Tax=Massilia sp. CCM 8734 TaxID=2609283 RepID=UPI001AAFB0BA